jgi:hypothetical protein
MLSARETTGAGVARRRLAGVRADGESCVAATGLFGETGLAWKAKVFGRGRGGFPDSGHPYGGADSLGCSALAGGSVARFIRYPAESLHYASFGGWGCWGNIGRNLAFKRGDAVPPGLDHGWTGQCIARYVL